MLLVRTPKSSDKPVDLAGAARRDPDRLRDRAGGRDADERARRHRQHAAVPVPALDVRADRHARARGRRRRACSSTSPSTCAATSGAARRGELVFHVFLAMLHDEGSVDDPNLPVAATRRALAATMKLVARRAREGRQRRVELGNVAVQQRALDGRSRALDEPLRLRRLWVTGERDERDESFRGVLLVSRRRRRSARTASRTCRRTARCWSRAICRSSSLTSNP